MKIIVDERCIQYSHAGHPERPARIAETLKRLKGTPELSLDWVLPSPATDEVLLRAHSPEHLDRLKKAQDFDLDTPYMEGIADHARLAAGAAVKAAEFARKNEPALSLMRPPGHHATRNSAMGFCYLSNIAIAVLDALAAGTERIAVFDFDVHHGNGTEAILLNVPGTAFYSVHQHPCYPGTGTRNLGNNCYNFPVPPQTARAHYREILESAVDAIRVYKPKLLAISAGFDAYAGDPLAQGTLLVEDFLWLGKELGRLGVPCFTVLEGGYSAELPELVTAYLQGLQAGSN
jgi:acetoin utilization deacetylase AcuC-like enzyme